MAKKDKNNEQYGVKTYAEFLISLAACKEHRRQELFDMLKEVPRPAFIGKIETPTTLNMLTYGQLDDLSRTTPNDDPFVACFKTILDVKSEDVYEMNVYDVFGFCNFVRAEIERINKLFAEIEIKHSSDEIAAGVKELSFGSFGVIDWYARRMGITNQDEVYDVGWIRIYTCMKNDAAQNNYERRLQEQSLRKMKKR